MVDERQDEPRPEMAQALLGYLNFSEGRPDPRFQKGLDEAAAALVRSGDAPVAALHAWLQAELARLATVGGAFRDAEQARAALTLLFTKLLPAYRAFHADLLAHQDDEDLFNPFFVARAAEALLAQGGPWHEEDRIVRGALTQLNDYVGLRPVAILETRPRGEPYEHEKVRPVPLYLKGAGVGHGRYHTLVARGLDVLAATDPSLREEAGFSLDLLDELAYDPRAFDFGHPANRRPNYAFGEWDPHHLDNQGRYRRYVARQVTLDALQERIGQAGLLTAEAWAEAGVVFAGTLLMATMTSGAGPGFHDSTTTLSTLVPRIARLRDAFYQQALQQIGGAHGARLRQEAQALRQPFGGARQHLNAALARQRALQMQQRHLALLFAEMGHADAARDEARRIAPVSVRMLTEVHGRLTTGAIQVERGDLAGAAAQLPEIEDLLYRGIACGALADPWNVLGFQGLFPVFPAREDAVRDGRVHELVAVMDRLFSLHARAQSEAAARGDRALVEWARAAMKRLAAWWDRFATTTVSEVRPVNGGEAVTSARQVAEALARWHERGESAADLAFWKKHIDHFRSPKAFALVVDALLRKDDYRAALGLLVSWVGQAEQVPLEDGEHSFHALALRGMLGLTAGGPEAAALARRFLDQLEANADELWQVPALDTGTEVEEEAADDEDDLFGAAYEGVTYQDSTDDAEGAVADGGALPDRFDLDQEGERLGRRLQFLTTVARLWHVAARRAASEGAEALQRWCDAARGNRGRLLALLDAVAAVPVPEPTGTFESVVEYDRRRSLKEQLLHTIIGTCLETELAHGALEGARAGDGPPAESTPYSPRWGREALQLERAIHAHDPEAVRRALPAFLRAFRDEPLLFSPLSEGGEPRQVLRVRLNQAVLRALAAVLPRLGLLRETYQVVRAARAQEVAHPPEGRGVTEFNTLFETAYRACVEAAVASAATWGPERGDDEALVDLLEQITTPFLGLWIDHSRSLQLAALEQVRGDEEWGRLRDFVRRYGRDLFDTRFLTMSNLRGILHRGVENYLLSLREEPDPLKPVRLLDDLGRTIAAEDAAAHLRVIIQAVLENYEEYKDFNATTTYSDYGDNLYILLDFLRLKASYDRHAWHFRPLVMGHEVLARSGRAEAAVLWQEEFAELTQEPAADHLEELAALEKEHRVRLGTVADRLQERFVKPLALDRLGALIEPAMAEARRGDRDRPAFERLQAELRPLTATPTGVGLDVPQWVRRLEAEVQRVRAAQTAVATLAEGLFRVPQRTIPFAEMEHQVQEWEVPPGE